MSFTSFILLTVLLTVAAQSDGIIRKTLIQRRSAQVKQLSNELENIGARNHVAEFEQILSILRSNDNLEHKKSQTSAISARLSESIKRFEERLTVAVDKQISSYRSTFATASPKVKQTMESSIALAIDINVLLDLNGQLSKMENLLNELGGADLAEFRRLDNKANA